MASTRESIFSIGKDLGGLDGLPVVNPYKEGSWQHKAFADGVKFGIEAHRMQRARAAAEAGIVRPPAEEPNRTFERVAVISKAPSEGDSFDAKAQACHLTNTFMSDDAAATGKVPSETDKIVTELGVEHIVNRVYPDRMPEVTREHVRRLDYMALGEPDSSRALRLDDKITKLYQRWA